MLATHAVNLFKTNSTEGRLIITKLINVIIFGAALSFQAGCTKSDNARIAEIDLELSNMVSSGNIEDADKRSLLRSERAVLVKGLSLNARSMSSQQEQESEPPPQARATDNTIVIAHDSRLQGATPMLPTWHDNSNSNSGRLYATPSRRAYGYPALNRVAPVPTRVPKK